MSRPAKHLFRRLCLLLSCALLGALSFPAAAEDIEIFGVNESGTLGNPNVLIVLDNSANWSRQSQRWPGGVVQGQSEVLAIRKVLSSLPLGSINVGFLEYSTAGSAATNEGGYVRHHVRPLSASNRATLQARLDTIYNNINTPLEKRSSGNGFGTLMWDVYNYLGGLNQSQNGAGTPAGLADPTGYTAQFSRFRSPLTGADDCSRAIVIFIGNNVSNGPSRDAIAAASALTAAGGDASQIPFANYSVSTSTSNVPRGYSAACYGTASDCTAAENNAECLSQGFDGCYCENSDRVACSLARYTVYGTRVQLQTVSDSTSSSAPTRVYTGENRLGCTTAQALPTYSCPATTTVTTQNSPVAGQQTTTTTSWSSCAYVNIGGSCNGPRSEYEPRGIRTVRTLVSRPVSSVETLGPAAACSSSAATCNTANYAACSNGTYASCSCGAPADTAGCAAGATSSYQVMGRLTTTTATANGSFSAPPGGPWMADEWARFLRQVGVPVGGSPNAPRLQVATYTIDVFNAQQNAAFSALLFNMARAGGGKYYQARSEDDLTRALTEIFAEALAVNSTFASPSLPVDTGNRAQSGNELYIGLFKPSRTRGPRWFGNLKRFKLVGDEAARVVLGDVDGRPAINPLTGFLSDCATSFWSTDSGDYWRQVISDDPDAAGTCAGSGSPHSDVPDGPFVEKGGVAQILRRANSATARPDANGNYPVVRNMKTLSGGNLVDLAASGLSPELRRYVRGEDSGLNPTDEDLDGVTNETRASIHGDVIHSRPQPVSFGDEIGSVIYYGANDGAYRAVAGNSGEEIWSFVAPEHLASLARLRNNSPPVNLSGGSAGKDYFFDGATGLYRNRDGSRVLIFPSQRRGGRKVYAFDVSRSLRDPDFLWSRGCPEQGNDSGCDAGFNSIGQTWSRPTAAHIEGFSTSVPALLFGGGYDRCEDADTPTPACGSTKGNGVFVLNAETGAVLRHFDLRSVHPGARAVAGDLSFIDSNSDGLIEFAYAADTGGNVYRIDFVRSLAGREPLPPAEWTVSRVAYTNGAGRKFLYGPAILFQGGVAYLALGSGDREHPLSGHYPSAGVVNRFYVFKDRLVTGGQVNALNLDSPTQMRDVTVDPGCDPDARVRPQSSARGWYLDLVGSGPGEQVVTTAVIAGGQVFFNTHRPTGHVSACSNALGKASGYIVDLLSGSGAIDVNGSCGGRRFVEFVSDGLPPSPVVVTVPVEIDGRAVIRTVLVGAAQKDGTPSGILSVQDLRPAIQSLRRPISWRRNEDSD